MLKKILCFVLLIGGVNCVAQTATIMTWNSLNFGTSASSNARIPHFQTVLDSILPDILVVQELGGEPGAHNYRDGILENSMAMAPFIDGYNSDNALFYNDEMFEAVSNIPIYTELRNISQYVMVHLDSGDTLRVFSVHLKASPGTANQAARLAEVDSLRLVTDAFSPESYYIVCGDFNIYSANEPAYERLTEAQGTTGYFIDPLPEMPGTWNNPDYAPYHTQSPRLRAFGGGASSGMDDRFDLILFSPNFSNEEDIAYVDNSTWAVGNDGNHYNDSVNHMPNTVIGEDMAYALHHAADHLPVLATIEFFNNTTDIAEYAQNELFVYPNPSHGIFYVDIPAYTDSEIRVLDTMGRLVYSTSSRGATNIDLGHLPKGMYYLSIVSDSKKEIVKLLLK